MEIQYIGVHEIPKRLRQPIDEMVKQFLAKFEAPQLEARVHVKRFERDGKQHRYEVHTRIMVDGHVFVSESEEWDCAVAIRDTLDSIKVQFDKFKVTHAAIAA
jgi:ribosome-associated translation inhibitor RaiA